MLGEDFEDDIAQWFRRPSVRDVYPKIFWHSCFFYPRRKSPDSVLQALRDAERAICLQKAALRSASSVSFCGWKLPGFGTLLGEVPPLSADVYQGGLDKISTYIGVRLHEGNIRSVVGRHADFVQRMQRNALAKHNFILVA